MLNELAASITSGIRDGADASGTLNQMTAFSALSSYDPRAASSALNEIKDALAGASNISSDLADQLDGAVSEVEQKVGAAGTDAANLTTEQLADLLSDYLGDYFENGTSAASEEDKAGALIALSMYAEDTDNTDARALAASVAGKMASEGNSYIYEKYDKDTAEYLSLKALSRILGYRYIFDNAHYTVTLSRSQKYYLFTSGKTEYMSTGKVPGRMQKAAGLMGTLYISGEDGSTIFGSTAYYVPKSNYASVRTSGMEAIIQEVYQMLMEGV